MGLAAGAKSPHGRSQRFDPLSRHQPKRFLVSIVRAACQKICQTITEFGSARVVASADRVGVDLTDQATVGMLDGARLGMARNPKERRRLWACLTKRVV
jgi:hypothetical protein